MHTEADLYTRPTLAAVSARYEQMQQRIRDALDTTLGARAWTHYTGQGDQTGCGRNFPPDLPNAAVGYLDPWGSPQPVTDDQWARADHIVTDISNQYGFTSTSLTIDEPGRHQLVITDLTLGAQISFGTQRALDMQVTTGCHPLTATPPTSSSR